MAFYKAGKWLEYLLLLAIAILISAIAFKINYKIGLLIAIGSIALSVLLLCFYHLEAGIYGMIIFAFLSAFIGRMFTADLPLATVLLSLPFILLTVMLLNINYERNKKWFIWHPIIFIYMVTVGYTIIQVFNPNMDSIPGWLSFFRARLASLATLLLFLYIFKDLKSIRFFFKFIVGAFFITALYGVIQQKIGFTSFETRWIYDTPDVFQLYSLPGQGMRKFSFLTDPANFGTLMAAGGASVLVLCLGPFSRKKKILLGFSVLVILMGISYSGTRTAYLMITAAVVLYALMTLYQKRTRILVCCAAGFLLFILYVPIYSNVTINRIRSAFKPPSSDASYDLRNFHRHEMQPFIQTHPFGNGVNTTMGAGKKYNPDNFLAGFPPDNLYFQIALEQGWIGLALNCIFFFVILFYAIHYFYRSKDPEIKTYYSALAAMLFAMTLGAYTQFTITSIPQNFVFIAFIACIIKLHTFDTPELAKSKA